MPNLKSDKSGVKILFIRDFLYSHTNENHLVTSKDNIIYVPYELFANNFSAGMFMCLLEEESDVVVLDSDNEPTKLEDAIAIAELLEENKVVEYLRKLEMKGNELY